MKQVTTTACLFREIFVVTGPLSRYLQNFDVDFSCKAIDMVDNSIGNIEQMQDEAEEILKSFEQTLKVSNGSQR